MKKREIPQTDLQVAPINFGGNVLGWTLDERESFRVLDAFYEQGFNFIDTADTYAWWVNGVGGQSETILGNWMHERKNRQQIVLATKVGSHTKEHGYDLSRDHILKSVDQSLKRLKTDYIDLYYSHFDDGSTPVEETLQAYAQLVEAGKVRYIGASNLTPERLRESFEVSERRGFPRYVALQPHFNLVERERYEEAYAPIAAEFNLGVFPYYALASGFLAGKYRRDEDVTKSVRGKSATKYLNEEGLAVLAKLDRIAEKYGSKPATVALAWLLAQPQVIAPIVSATSPGQLQELLAAVDLKLDAEDLALLSPF